MSEKQLFDTIVLGAGAAGMASSIYLSRYRLNHLIFGETPGGQFVDATVVENYPGITSIQGADLVANFKDHVESYGVKIRPERVGEVRKVKDGFEVKTAEGETFTGRTIILAMGARHRLLNVPGEDKFLGKGVSYCATCDAPLFKGKTVAVVGGGDSAVAAAAYLASYAEKVYIIQRRDEFTAAEFEVEKMRSHKNVIEVTGNTVKEILGKETVGKIVLNNPVNQASELPVDGVFVEIGLVPASSIAKALGVKIDTQGYIEVNPAMETAVEGVFAAGDLTLIPGALPFRQIVTSAADGARAAAAVYQHLRQQPPTPDWG